MGLVVWNCAAAMRILPSVLFPAEQIWRYYNTVASSIAFTHLQNKFNFFSFSFSGHLTKQRIVTTKSKADHRNIS